MYYKVTVIRGHCGAGRGNPITFVFEVDSSYDAMQRAKRMPMVKHKKFSAIKSVEPITKAEYDEFRKVSAYNGVNWMLTMHKDYKDAVMTR